MVHAVTGRKANRGSRTLVRVLWCLLHVNGTLCHNSGGLSSGFHHGSPDSITERLKKKDEILLRYVIATTVRFLSFPTVK